MPAMSTFLTVRIFVTVAFAIASFIFFKKKFKKFKVMEYLFTVTIFFALSAFVPAENIFKFATPGAALQYQTTRHATDVIDSEKFSVVLYKKNERAVGVFQTGKSGNKYTLPMLFNDTGKMLDMPYDYPGLTAYICRAGGSDKAILVIIEYDALAEGDRYSYTDTQNSLFKQLNKRLLTKDDETIVSIHYAEIDANDKNYNLSIDNKVVFRDLKIK